MSEAGQPTRCILYVDIDAFFPSVEQVKFPLLRGRPLIVCSGVAASSSYEARNYGIRPGTPITTAMKLCPQVVVLKGHQPTYQAFAQKVFDCCRRLSPAVEAYLDEAFCDLTGTPAVRSDPHDVASDLKTQIRRATGLSVTIGIGSNRMVAKLVAKDVKPGGIGIVRAGEEAAFMHDRPLSDVPGIGPKAQQLLGTINIRRVCDLRALPLSYLEQIFGRSAPLIHERLYGRDPWVPPAMPRSISRETSLPRDSIDFNEVTNVLYYLTERACRKCRNLRLLPRRVHVKVRYGDGVTRTASRTIGVSSVSDRAIFAVAVDLFHRVRRRCRIHLIGICLSQLASADAFQANLLSERHKDFSSLYRTLDEIRTRFGHSAVIAGKAINLMTQLERDTYGFILRTPSLTK